MGDVRRGLIYLARVDDPPLLVDAWLPPSDRTPAPVVVMVHGGGWAMGSRESFGPAFDEGEPVFATVAAAGHLVLSVDYRLSGEAVFPAQLDDVLAAVVWAREHAAGLGGDPTRLVVWGESAGGHLAALAALDPSTHVSAAVCWYPPCDLTTLAGQALADSPVDAAAPDSRESLLLGVALPDAGELAVAASPVAHVHPGAPPFLLVHGTADRFVPAAQSVQLHEALLAAGASSRLELVPGADHLWRGVEDPGSILDLSLGFVAAVLS